VVCGVAGLPTFLLFYFFDLESLDPDLLADSV
jgi:hypothetical protein